MKILVTGAEGFIGSHVVEELIAGGHEVTALYHYNATGQIGWLSELDKLSNDQLRIVAGDVRDAAQMDNVVSSVNAICHLAALIGIPYSYSAPDSYFQTNVMGTLNLLNSARRFGIERFIQTSTSEVYGTAKITPMSEAHPLNAQSPYAASKVAADSLALSYYYSFDTPVTVIRPFNTYGPRQSNRAVIPALASQFVSNASEIHVGNTDSVRDFTFVLDTARAFSLAVDSRAAIGETINLGTGFEVSVGDIISILQEVTGTYVPVVEDARRIRPAKSEVMRLISDNSKAKELLGWQPSFMGMSGFREGIAKYIDWLSQRPGLTRGPHHYAV